jgi:ATP-dependent RNA circularization protein (DNA/RNA ligase family)
MTKRKFFSIKYQKYILPDNRDFWNIARDEAVYRLDENLSRWSREAVAMRDKKMNCPCLGHMEER